MQKVLIIIPAYNEAENIERVVGRLVSEYPQYDYLVVNDGSSDMTAQICRTHGYHLLDLPVNLGLSGAIRSGMCYALEKGYAYAIQLDGDGQHDPCYIKAMLQEMEKTGCDIVIGSRFVDEEKPASMRMLGSRLLSGVIRLTTGKQIEDVTSGMRLFNRRMIERFSKDMHYSPEPDTLAYLLNCGVQIREVQVEMHERVAGESYLKPGKAAWYMIKMMFSILVFQWFRER